jgi:hypothetical protein
MDYLSLSRNMVSQIPGRYKLYLDRVPYLCNTPNPTLVRVKALSDPNQFPSVTSLGTRILHRCGLNSMLDRASDIMSAALATLQGVVEFLGAIWLSSLM